MWLKLTEFSFRTEFWLLENIPAHFNVSLFSLLASISRRQTSVGLFPIIIVLNEFLL